VDVDSPEDFEVVDSSEIPSILCLPTSNLQNPSFQLDVLRVSLACKFFWIKHKIIGFVGEVAVHLLLGLAINKICKNKSKNKSKKTRVRETRLD
jgi:hypothetical protein